MADSPTARNLRHGLAEDGWPEARDVRVRREVTHEDDRLWPRAVHSLPRALYISLAIFFSE